MVIRKGAISAKEGERVIIPLNMRDGLIIGVGKGNAEWNSSAPHGAGRVLSRVKAKETLSLDEFNEKMNGIWTSCISMNTIDESPMAYKDMNIILNSIGDSVEILDRIVPICLLKRKEQTMIININLDKENTCKSIEDFIKKVGKEEALNIAEAILSSLENTGDVVWQLYSKQDAEMITGKKVTKEDMANYQDNMLDITEIVFG